LRASGSSAPCSCMATAALGWATAGKALSTAYSLHGYTKDDGLTTGACTAVAPMEEGFATRGGSRRGGGGSGAASAWVPTNRAHVTHIALSVG
jgi:hypothetical protein